MAEYRIGDVARLTGTNSSTLRLWEQHGLITPTRTDTGQRTYSAAQLQRIGTIQRLRKVEGLNMSAIRRVLDERPGGQDRAPGAAEPAATPAPAARGNLLGHQFRAARHKLKMSLREAAERSGLPVSFISTFERTNKGATVASLQKLATCYGTTVTALSSPPPVPSKRRPEVVRQGKEPMAPQFGAGIQILQLAQSLPSLDCQKWILAPGARSEGAYAHSGEEFIHVLSGELYITVDLSARIRLRSGDSIAFASERPHAWAAGEHEPTVLIWVNTPKSF